MDPYTAMMSTDKLDEEQLRMLADQLRGGSATGARLATSSLEPIQNQGRLMQTRPEQQAQQVGLMQSRKMASDQSAREAQLKADTLSGTLGFAKPSNRATEKFEESAGMVGNIKGMTESFSDEFVGSGPMSGGLEEFMGRQGMVPSTQTQDDMANWWGNWKGHYENIQRNKLFGSALTDSEKAEWRKANINSDMSPKDIRQRMAVLNRLNDKMAAYAARNAINKQWDPTYVKDVYDGTIPDAAFESKENLDAYVDQTREGFTDAVSASSAPVSGGNLRDLSNRDLMLMLEQMGD